MLFVLTLKVVLNVNVRQDITAILITVCVRPHNVVAQLTRNAARMRSAFNLANVFVRHLSSLTLETFVEIHASDSLAESTLNAVRLIHLNACAKLVSKAIPCKDASALMNVRTRLARMELSVSLRREAINAFVPMECQAMLTRAVVSSKILFVENRSARRTQTALQIFIVEIALASALALIFYADRTLSANQRIMLAGAAAVLDTQKVRMEIVFPVSFLNS